MGSDDLKLLCPVCDQEYNPAAVQSRDGMFVCVTCARAALFLVTYVRDRQTYTETMRFAVTAHKLSQGLNQDPRVSTVKVVPWGS